MQNVKGGEDTDTLTNIEDLIGSAFNDALTVSDDDNEIHGNTGYDSINAGDGNDPVVWFLGDGVDVYVVVADDDDDSQRLDVTTENEGLMHLSVTASPSENFVLDNVENLVLLTGSDDDDVYVDDLDGTDLTFIDIELGSGNDKIDGGVGNDKLVVIGSYNGETFLVEGQSGLPSNGGNDLATFLAQNGEIEDEAFAVFHGNDDDNGATANDGFVQGDDSALGDTGNDTVDGGSVNDTLMGGAGNDELRGNDDIYWFAADPFSTIDQHDGDDLIVGGAGDNDALILNGTIVNDIFMIGLADGSLPSSSGNDGVVEMSWFAQADVNSGIFNANANIVVSNATLTVDEVEKIYVDIGDGNDSVYIDALGNSDITNNTIIVDAGYGNEQCRRFADRPLGDRL